MLEAVHLTKRYASLPAVQDLSFTLRPGQVLGCLGPNGSGKSTTVKMLTGLLEPTRGSVQFDGRSIGDDLASYRKLLGYVPEEAHLYPYLTGWEYLEMVGTLRGMPESDINLKIDSLLQLFSLHSSRFASMSRQDGLLLFARVGGCRKGLHRCADLAPGTRNRAGLRGQRGQDPWPVAREYVSAPRRQRRHHKHRA